MAVGSKSKQGDRVATDAQSQADLMFSNGIKLTLTADSVVHLKTLKQEEGSLLPPSLDNKSQKETAASLTEIEVETGKVIGDVKKLAPNSVFTLKTPVGTVRIKGTVFSIEFKTNKDGTVSFGVGCLVGRVQVQMADPSAAPMTVPAGQKLTMSAPAAGPAGPDGGPAGGPAKAAPPMQMKLAPLPAAEAKELAVRAPDQAPPPPPPGAPPPPPAQAQALDRVIQETANAVMTEQVNPSPTGG
jgi:hypothetical protein